MSKLKIARSYQSTIDKIVYLEMDAKKLCISSFFNVYRSTSDFFTKNCSIINHPNKDAITIGLFEYANKTAQRLLQLESVRLSNGYVKNFEWDYLDPRSNRRHTLLGSMLVKVHTSKVMHEPGQLDLNVFDVSYTYTEDSVFIKVKSTATEKTILSHSTSSCRFLLCVLWPLMNRIPKITNPRSLFSETSATVTLDYLSDKFSGQEKRLSCDSEIKTHVFCLTITKICI